MATDFSSNVSNGSCDWYLNGHPTFVASIDHFTEAGCRHFDGRLLSKRAYLKASFSYFAIKHMLLVFRVTVSISRFILEPKTIVKVTKSAIMNIFLKIILFKSFVKIELSNAFTINLFTTAENCIEK